MSIKEGKVNVSRTITGFRLRIVRSGHWFAVDHYHIAGDQ
jgi:hypothetical protein